MKGRVDEARRALLEIGVVNPTNSMAEPVTVWIDTAFDGCLVFSKALIERLRLEQEATTEAILADGSRVYLESFGCRVEWFGEIIDAQVIANDGKLPLLGTELLAERRLNIDYAGGTLLLE